MAWRSNTTHELPKSRRAWTEDAHRTITSPTTTRAPTSAASSTNTAGERRRAGGRLPARAGRRARLGWRALVLVPVRERSAVGTAVLGEKLPDSAPEVVAALGVGPVPVEGGAARREEHGVAWPGQRRRRQDGLVHRLGSGDRPHAG